jgi:molybdenum cofactor cytidylyltransferase
MSSGAILLAAGGSSRLGQPKQLLRIGGESLLRRAARVLAASSARPIAVVLGAEREACAAELAGLPVEPVFNPAWAEGIASSIRAGLAAVRRSEPEVEAVLIALCDQPLLTVEIVEALLAAPRAATGGQAVACAYRGILGVPARFAATLFAELAGLTGDRGARQIIARHASEADAIPFPGGAFDVDAAGDLAPLARLARLAARPGDGSAAGGPPF